MLPHQKNLQFIQMLRGIACILVALMHISVTFFNTYHSYFLGNIFKFGGSGVDIFFVLSGFIITYSNRQYITRASGIGKFLKKRAIRIFPIYWIIISFFLLVQLLLPGFYRTHFPLNFSTIVTTYLLWPNHNMVNGVSWTLTNELFFYLLFTIALLVPQKKAILFFLFAYLFFLIVLPILPFVTIGSNNTFTSLLIFPMNIEFLMGILVVLFLEQFPIKWCMPFAVAGTGLFIVSAIAFDNGISFFHSVYDRALLFGFPSFLIILSLVKYELAVGIKINNLTLRIGDASYSIYLFHLPVIAAFFKIMAKLPLTNHFILVMLSCGVLIFVCFTGLLIYKNIEAPVIKRLSITFS